MMDFLGFAKKRKTVYEFSPRPVSEKTLSDILEAGRWSPSHSNSQPWLFKVVKETRVIDDLLKSCYYGGFHTRPNLIVALVASEAVLGHELHVIKDRRLAMQTTFMAIGMSALNMVLEAESKGISSCFLTPAQKASRTVLGLSEKQDVPLLVGFGYEAKGAFQKARERKRLKDLVLR